MFSSLFVGVNCLYIRAVCLEICSQQTIPFSPPCSHHLLHFRKELLPPSISTFLPIYLSTSFHHPPLSASVVALIISPPFPLALFTIFSPQSLSSSHFSSCFSFLPTSFSLLRLSSILSPTFFFNPRRVSQLKAFSSSYRPVVSLCTIRSALALGFCNSLTSSLPFLSSLCGFFSPPRFVSFIFSPDLSTEVFAL